MVLNLFSILILILLLKNHMVLIVKKTAPEIK